MRPFCCVTMRRVLCVWGGGGGGGSLSAWCCAVALSRLLTAAGLHCVSLCGGLITAWANTWGIV